MNQRKPPRCLPAAFTLVELLAVVLIIALLMGILIPTVSRVRSAAKEAESKALITQIQGAVEQYNQQYGAYPGPLGNNEIWVGAQPKSPASELVEPLIFEPNGSSPMPRRTYITGPENLVLGLMGGLRRVQGTGGYVTAFDKDYVGKGAMSLNDAQPKSGDPLVSGLPLSKGRFSDAIAQAHDTDIPEILDRFADPMPILYLRAKRGAGNAAIASPDFRNNHVITWSMFRSTGPAYRAGTYHLEHIIAYTGAYTSDTNDVPDTSHPPSASARSLGEGKSLSKVSTDGSRKLVSLNGAPFHGLGKNTTIDPDATANMNDPEASRKYYYPYDPYAYFVNPTLPQPTSANPNVIPTARNKDSYILISAGKDRVYGTDDDITNFGSVSGQ